MIARALLWFGLAALSLPAIARNLPTATAGLQSEVEFSDYSPLSRSTELARRLLSPLNALHVSQESILAQKPMREQPIDLAHEKFAVYVPSHAPAHGYALMVFVPPWETATVPRQWTSALDRHDMIFVSAANSGNGADVLDRREPLALLAAHNILRRYPIDPERVYVGGFSGGSRVALRIALGYPDVFHAVLLNAGSDPIGNAQLPLPPADLVRELQEATRFVYVTGAHDNFHLDEDVMSRQSLQEWCVFDVLTEDVPRGSHEVLDAAAFNRSLDALVEHARPDSKKLAACRGRIDQALDAQLKEVENLRARGKSAEARSLLAHIDARYGGLAAPRSSELALK